MKSGAELIAEERQRQVEEKGWTAEHDDEHDCGELALAAVCYATPELLYREDRRPTAILFVDPWPWDPRWDDRKYNEKLPTQRRIRQLTKAGALIAAEIDRLQRL